MTINKEKKYKHLSYSVKEIISLIVIFTVIMTFTLILALHKLNTATTTTATTVATTDTAAIKSNPKTIQLTGAILDSTNTTIRPAYDSKGNPPSAPGLTMKARVFNSEPSKVVYITIDDGPYPQNTPHLLEVLKKENVKATFFNVGKQIEQFPLLLKAEYEQGHSIGNHTYSHDYNSIYKNPEAFLADIQKNDDLIYNVIGIHPKIIRAPGGTLRFDISYYNLLDANDYIAYDWNIDTNDSEGKFSVKQLVDNVDKQMENKSKIILIMHDLPNKSSSINALPIIIKHFKELGYSFDLLSNNIRPILFPAGFRNK